jgi:hypothetical protein
MPTKPEKSKKIKSEEKVLLTFLKKTKEGKYAPVDMEAIASSRATQEYSMIIHPEEEYYYSVS